MDNMGTFKTMTNMEAKNAFEKAKAANLNTLEQYVPIVDRVHGGTHPVFHDVRSIFEAISSKIKEAGSATPLLTEEFAKLRELTGNYAIPGDVCEAYEAVYRMLGELDQAYHG